MKIYDIGANLTDAMFKGIYHGKTHHLPDIPQILSRSLSLGVHSLLLTAGSPSELHESVHLIQQTSSSPIKMMTTVGVHPTRCMELEEDPEMLGRLVEEGRRLGSLVGAVGEFGLDYDRLQFCPAPIQLKWFERQFEIADALPGKPLFIHMRASSHDLLPILGKNRHRFPTAVIHSFDGTIEEAGKIIDLDLYIGINGCSLKTAEALEVVKRIPLERIMVESDAPWCAIRPSHPSHALLSPSTATPYKPVAKEKYKGEAELCVKGRNEPWAARQVLEVLAALHNVDVETAADIIYQTTTRIFPMP